MRETAGAGATIQGPRPFLICPEVGCGYAEQASRVIHTSRSWLSAKTYLEPTFTWVAERCPRDGNLLVGPCDHCGQALADPADFCCRHCGKRYWWHVDIGDVAADAWSNSENLLDPFGRVSVYALRQSITNIIADAVVSTDDAAGEMRSRSAARLKEVGGPEIESESMAHPHALGDAWRTNPGDLDAKHVIHIGLLDAKDSTTEDLIKLCLANSLQLGDEHQIKSLVYPALGTGRSGFPMIESAKLAREAVSSYVDKNPRGTLRDIAFVLFMPEQLTEFRLGFTSSSKSTTGEPLEAPRSNAVVRAIRRVRAGVGTDVM